MMTPMPGSRLLAALLAGCVAALALAAGAGADDWQIKRTAAGNAEARAAVVARADLGSSAAWQGGSKKPDLSSTPPCPGWEPKQSDLVVIGAAETSWKTTGLQIDSHASVLRTPAMVRLDWQRTVATPRMMPCLRTALSKEIGASGRLVSIRRVKVPRLASYTVLIRVVVDVPVSGTTARVMVDTLLIGRGRTEATMTISAPYAARTVVAAAELRLGRLIAGADPRLAVRRGQARSGASPARGRRGSASGSRL